MSEDPKAWNHSNVQSVGGCCLVVGDRLYFYSSGRAGAPKGPGDNGTGLSTLRRDGFISMDAGRSAGFLTTRPVRFSGRYLFVNVDSPNGELRVEALGEDGHAIAPFTLENCAPIRVDNTLQAVAWKGGADLSTLAGRPIRFRFRLRQASLYSFWVSPDSSGASHGFVAAGGPGFTGPTDTVGRAIYAHGFARRALQLRGGAPVPDRKPAISPAPRRSDPVIGTVRRESRAPPVNIVCAPRFTSLRCPNAGYRAAS